MRGFLVLFGLLLAALVAFVVVWPRLVDEAALRAELARALAAAGGAGMQLDGAVRLEILPLPRLVIERAVLGSRAEPGRDTQFTADRIDVALAPLALLAGRLEPRGLQLVRPRLTVTRHAASLLPLLLRGLGTGELVDVTSLRIVDGTLVLGGAGWPPPIEAIDLRGERDPAGAFTLELAAAMAGDPVRLTLSGEPLAPEVPIHLEARLETGSRAAPAILEFAGQLTPRPTGLAAGGALHLNTEQGALPGWLSVGTAAPPLDLRARLAGEGSRLELSDLELAVGDGRLRGAFVLTDAPERSFDLSLEGASLTLTSELAEAGRRLLLAARADSPLPGRIGLQLANLAWRDQSVRRLQAELALAGSGGMELRRLQAVLPGEAALSWTSGGPAAGDAPLTGQLALQAGELRRLLSWLGVSPEDMPNGGLTSLELSAAAALTPDRLRLTGLRARVDATQLQGSVELALEPRPRLDVALVADRVNTALYVAPPGALPSWGARLDALDGSLDLTVDRLSHDSLRGQGFRLRAALEAGQLDLEELLLADLAQARLAVRGTADLGLGAYDMAGELVVPDPKPILRLLRIEPPPEIDRLAPLRLRGQSRREAGSASLDLRLSATGAEAALTGRLDGPMATGAFDLVQTLDAADTADVLLALGWPAPPDQPLHGPLRTRLAAKRADGPTSLELQASAAGSELAANLTWMGGGPRPLLAGELRAPLLDTAFAAALYDTLALPLQFPAGTPWLWPGVWPRQPLDWGWLRAGDLDLALAVARLRHQGRDLPGAAAELSLRDGRLALSGLTMPVGGGTLDGQVSLDGSAGYARLATDLRLRDAQAETLAALLAPGTGLRGRLDLEAKLEGQGRSVAELVGSLDGSGSVALGEARLPEVGATEASPVLEGVSLQGPFGVESGMATSLKPGLALAFPSGNGKAFFRLDLLAWILDASIEAGALNQRFLGPPGRLKLVPAGP